MTIRMKQVILCLVLLPGLLLPVAGAAREVVGWIENVQLLPSLFELKAKIDSGAKTSSVSCECHNYFERNGARWVRFSIITSEGETHALEREIVRTAKIKRHFGKVQERPVVKLGICLGGVYRESEVTIIDRSGLKYPMLIGRNFMEDDFFIDPSAKYRNAPHCEELLKDE